MAYNETWDCWIRTAQPTTPSVDSVSVQTSMWLDLHGLSWGQFTFSIRRSSNSIPPYDSRKRIGSPSAFTLKYVNLYVGAMMCHWNNNTSAIYSSFFQSAFCITPAFCTLHCPSSHTNAVNFILLLYYSLKPLYICYRTKTHYQSLWIQHCVVSNTVRPCFMPGLYSWNISCKFSRKFPLKTIQFLGVVGLKNSCYIAYVCTNTVPSDL